MTDIEKHEAAFLELDRARKALAEAETLPEITTLIDRAEVMRVAARKAKLSLEAQNDWAEYKLDTERKAGQMLKDLREQGLRASPGQSMSRTETYDGPTSKTYDGPTSRPPTLSELLDDKPARARLKASTWEKLADLPAEDYEGYKAAMRASGKEITEAGAVRIAKHRERERQKYEQAAKFAEVVAAQPDVTLGSWEDWLPGQPICDLLLTDPPYSTDVDDIFAFAKAWLPMALEKVKSSGRAYVCIGAYPAELLAYLSVDPPEHLTLANVLVWTYRNTLGPKPSHDYKLNWQAILYYRGRDAPPLDSPEMVEQFSVQDINAPDGRRGDRWHAWQKPDLLAERLIRHSTQKGDRVIDPFAGTGTFLLAAAKLGRDAVGCDVSEENLAIAVERGCRRA